MYKIRMRFSKKQLMIFISHLDLMRMMERALRRAHVPLAFSQGFNPHPKISFAQALALGTSSDGEYMDIVIEEKIDIESVKDKLNAQLPEGLKILKCQYINQDSKALMADVKYSEYMIKNHIEDTDEKSLIQKIEAFLKLEEIMIVKEIKKRNRVREKEINIRPLIKSMNFVSGKENTWIIKCIVATGSDGNVKPEWVFKKFAKTQNLSIDLESMRIHRLELYGEKNGRMVSLLEK